YGEGMLKILSQYPLEEQDVLVAAETIQGGDEDAVSTIQPIMQKYRNFTNDLLNISIPAEAVSVHLPFLNAVHNYAETTARIVNLDAEPLVALKAVTDFQASVDQLVQAYVDLEAAFNE